MRRQSVNTYHEHVYNNPTRADYDLFNGYLAKSPLSVGHIRPPELISFNGVLNNGRATLYWTTENRTNNGNYILERSNDGVYFKFCDNVSAMKNDDISTYAYTDSKPIYTNAWYRLRSADKHGTATYSNIVLLSVIASQELEIYPYGVELKAE